MISLDTNGISEPWKPAPDAAVVTWLDAQAIETLFVSAISVLNFDLASRQCRPGRRQTILYNRLEDEVLPHFVERTLSFTLSTSRFYSELMAGGRASGKAIGKADGLIAAPNRRELERMNFFIEKVKVYGRFRG